MVLSPFILPASVTPLIQFQNVSVNRGGRLGLRDFTMLINSGEHVAILGPNGSGKSTLIKTITRECYPQDAGDFHPATTNVWGAEYPRVDSAGRAQIRVKAPDATKVKVNFWSGPKVDMEKQSDGYWMVTTTPLVPGLHYYTLVIDGAEVSDLGSQAFFGGSTVTRARLHPA